MRHLIMVAALLCGAAVPARAELRPDLGVEAGGSLCGQIWFGVGAGVHAGLTMTVDEFRIGASVAGDIARFFDDGGGNDNGAPIDIYHLSGRLRGGPAKSPLYLLLGFGATYYTNRLEEGERFEVPAIAHWSPMIVTGGGMDLGRFAVELNVRQPLDAVLVNNTGFSIGIQLDLRVGVRL
jgi:hypothetical protein